MDDSLSELSCEEFSERLAARTSVPGGGGAVALAGALAAALCSMAGSFTAGKPRYADVEGEVLALMDEAEEVRCRLLELIEEDAAGFLPVTEALALPRDDPRRADAVERAIEGACMAPLATMGECCRAIALLERMGGVCAPALVSDVATGAYLARAALEGASVNVYVNATMLRDRALASRIEASCDELLEGFSPRASALADAVTARIRGRGRRG